jgi:predicted nucleic acid-binding protein
MSRIIFIDSGPLGFALTPTANAEHFRCSQWLETLIFQGEQIAIAEIVDYECRRGWLRHDNLPALQKLDQAKAGLIYVPISTEAMLQAAEFWAAARKGGYATTTDQRLDAGRPLGG